MNHYTYLLTHKQTGKLYIGVRSCKCLPEEDTKYMSSSKYVKESGVGNFTKEILNIFKSRAEAELDEKTRLTEANARNSDDYYNMCHGAEGFNTLGLRKETSKLIRQNAEKQKQKWKEHKEEMTAKVHHPNRDYSNHEKSLAKGRGKGKSRLTGDSRTDAQKALAEANSVRMSAKNNPAHTPEAQAKRVATITGRKRPKQSELMMGRISIYKDGVYKSVKADTFTSYESDGWIKQVPPRSSYNMKNKICPYCGLEGKGGNMTRYHFDNCKYKIKESA